MKTRNAQACNAYAQKHAQALELIESIKESLQDMPAPDDTTNWAHVGDMGRVVDNLIQASESAR